MSDRRKPGRIMLRAAALQFLSYHFGKPDYLDGELEDLEDCINTIDEIELLRKQRHLSPRLSDEFADD